MYKEEQIDREGPEGGLPSLSLFLVALFLWLVFSSCRITLADIQRRAGFLLVFLTIIFLKPFIHISFMFVGSAIFPPWPPLATWCL